MDPISFAAGVGAGITILPFGAFLALAIASIFFGKG